MTNELAERIRARLGGDPNVGEIRMLGGICFTLNRNMLIGTMKDGTLLARIGEEQEKAALAKPGASRMNFTGREMKGFIVVAQDALDDKALKGWIAMATSYVGALPPKAEKESRRKNA